MAHVVSGLQKSTTIYNTTVTKAISKEELDAVYWQVHLVVGLQPSEHFRYSSLTFTVWITPTTAGTGITVPSITTFESVFYIRGYAGCYVGGLSELCHKCVTDIWKRLLSGNCWRHHQWSPAGHYRKHSVPPQLHYSMWMHSNGHRSWEDRAIITTNTAINVLKKFHSSCNTGAVSKPNTFTINSFIPYCQLYYMKCVISHYHP